MNQPRERSPVRKIVRQSRRSTWTGNDLVAFRTFLAMVMRPSSPPAGREKFLKLHPVCDSCRNYSCEVSDAFGVRCLQCVKKHKRCPRQIQFWIVSIAELMSKPTAVVAEMYELFGSQVLPRYGHKLGEGDNTSDVDSDCGSSSCGTEIDVIEDIYDDGGLTARERKRNREKAETQITSRAPKIRRTDENRDAIYQLIAKFAICRDSIRSTGRDLKMDPRAEPLMNALEELDVIGEELSNVLVDCKVEPIY